MAVLLTVLQILAVFVAVLLILFVVALLLPLGFAVEYRPDHFRVSAVYGPLRRTVWYHRFRRKKSYNATVSSQTESSSSPAREAAPTQAASLPSVGEGPAEQVSLGKLPSAPEKAALPEEEEEELPSGVAGRLDRMLSLLEEEPQTFGRCVLGHMRWLHRHSLFKISVRHADVFWTVTCEDASTTAIAYGAELAAFNTALALVQQTVHLQSDRLWLEPDFTGTRRSERKIACTVSASAILMAHLLYRIWKDPLLQPQPQPQMS